MNSLLNVDRRCADLIDRADDLKVVTEPRRLTVADVDLDHGIGASRRAQLGRLVDSDRADHVRARPLHELQVIGIIDDAVGVRVLEIDRQREMMLTAHKAAAIRHIQVEAHFALPISPTSRIRSPCAIAMSARCMPQPGRNMPNTADFAADAVGPLVAGIVVGAHP